MPLMTMEEDSEYRPDSPMRTPLRVASTEELQDELLAMGRPLHPIHVEPLSFEPANTETYSSGDLYWASTEVLREEMGIPNYSPRWVPNFAHVDVAHDHVPDDCFRFTFTFHQSKLVSRERMVVSDSFGIPLKLIHVPFRILLTATYVHHKRHGQSFKTARGRGKLQLKCEDGNPSDDMPPLSFSFQVGSDCRKRGPVIHNFAHNPIGGLLQGEDEWDFASAAEPETGSVHISLEATW